MAINLVARSERQRLRVLASNTFENILWAGGATQQDQQQPCPCSTSYGTRGIHTTAPLHWEKFERVLRKPVPKAHVLNRTNFEAWRSSSLDVGLAQQLLADMDASARSSSRRNATAALKELVQAAASLPELELVEEQVGHHMTPELLVSACAQALMLRDKALAAPMDSRSAHPNHLYRQTSALVCSLLQRLPGRLTDLSTKQLALVMACMARGMPTGLAHVEGALVQELSAAGAHRLVSVEPQLVANMLQSAAKLGWARSQQHVWGMLCSSALANRDISNPNVMARLVGAARDAHDRSSALWPRINAALQNHVHQWMADSPALVADMLYKMAKSGVPSPMALDGVADMVVRGLGNASNGHRLAAAKAINTADGTGPPGRLDLTSLPPWALCRLGYALGKLGSQEGLTNVATEAALTRICAIAANTAARVSLSDLSLLLAALSTRPAGAPQPPLVQVVRDLVAVRGLTGPAHLQHTLTLVEHLVALQGQQQPLLQLLTNRALKLLPRLPAQDVSALMLCWAHHASPKAATQLMPAAVTQLVATPGYANADALLPAMLAACHCLARTAPTATAAAAAGGDGSLQQQVLKLADSLVATPDFAEVAARPDAKRTQQLQQLRLLLAQPGVGLQQHALATKLPTVA